MAVSDLAILSEVAGLSPSNTHLTACYAQLGQMDTAREFVASHERERPANADFPRYVAAHCKLCKRAEDAEHWRDGYRKAGLIN